MKTTAAVVETSGSSFTLQEIDIESPRQDEVLVKVVASGICHTDSYAAEGNYPIPFPAIFGHEGAGIVEKVGSNVHKVVPGDHVLLTFGYCGHCHNCQESHQAYCYDSRDLNVIGTRKDKTSAYSREGEHVSGHFFGHSSFASHSITKEANVIKVDPSLPLPLLAPLGCGIQTGAGAILNTLGLGSGDEVAIIGSGSVGLAAIMAAKLAGCTKIIAADILDSRLELAKKLGATHCINSKEQDLGEELLKLSDVGLDAVLDLTCSQAVMTACLNALKKRGTLLLGGATEAGNTANFDINTLLTGKSVRGVVRGDSTPDIFLPELINHYQAGRLPLEELVSYYPFEEINQAIDDAHSGKCVKAVLIMDETYGS